MHMFAVVAACARVGVCVYARAFDFNKLTAQIRWGTTFQRISFFNRIRNLRVPDGIKLNNAVDMMPVYFRMKTN